MITKETGGSNRCRVNKRLPRLLGLAAGLSALILVGCSPQEHAALPDKDLQFSFDRPPFISPKIIQDLMTWISDRDDQVVSINVLGSQDSNRYSGDVLNRNIAGQNPYIYTETTTVENDVTNHTEFGYQFVGKTSSGVYVLATSDWGGGSSVFNRLLLVKFEQDQYVKCDWDKGIVRPDGKRLLIKKVGEIGLGDRWDGDLKVEGDSIFVGKDHGWFTISGGTGGNALSSNPKDRVLKITAAQ